MIKQFTRRMMLVAGIGMAATLAAGPALATNLTGDYRVEGRNPNGSSYKGSVQIVETNGRVTMNWQVGRSYSGLGLVEGRVLSVNWGAADPVIYVINPDGTLYGTWAKGKALELLILK